MDVKKRNLILMLSLLIGGSGAIAAATVGIQYSATKKNNNVNHKNAIREVVLSTYSHFSNAKPFYRYLPIRDNYLIYLKNFSIVYNNGSVELLDNSKSNNELQSILDSLKKKELSVTNEITKTGEEYEKYISKVANLRKEIQDIIESSKDQNEKDTLNKTLVDNNPDDMQILSTYIQISDNLEKVIAKHKNRSN
ncbi:hypothetical protein AB5V95_01990 [Metamycoplasma spumans]|uniref:hypothetical protein n=1 Tax=Metamycoplasma spumans TaxID=92406 RepID=UPI0034DD4D9C